MRAWMRDGAPRMSAGKVAGNRPPLAGSQLRIRYDNGVLRVFMSKAVYVEGGCHKIVISEQAASHRE
jgi:hypothetical protein